jgi:hypothetical protein
MIKKYITKTGMAYEIGDFYEGQPITDIELDDNYILTIRSGLNFWTLTSKPGDWVYYTDGTNESIKSKFDKDEQS